MYASLIALLALLAPVELEGFPLDVMSTIELNNKCEDVEGFGKVVWVDYHADFDGKLHLWTRSTFDLMLVVEDVSGNVLFEDDNSGGELTPFLQFEVRTGNHFRIGVVAREPKARGWAQLKQMAFVETFETVKGVAAVDLELQEVSDLIRQGKLESARAQVVEIYNSIVSIRGHRTSGDAALTMFRLITFALNCEATQVVADATEYLRVGTERTHPPDHAALTKLRAREAIARKAAGDVAGALELEKIVLAFRERSFSPSHISVVKARRNLAMSFLELGESEEAQKLLKWVLELESVRLQPGDTELVDLQEALAKSLKATGDIAEARKYEEQVLLAYENSLHDQDPVLIEARINLAESLDELGEIHRSLNLLEAVFLSNEQLLTTTDPRWLGVQSDFASLLRQTSEFGRALEIDRRVLAELERTHSMTDAVRLRALAQLGASLHASGDVEQALSIRQQVFDAYRRQLDVNDFVRLRAELDLSVTMSVAGNWHAARVIQERLVIEYGRLVMEDHVDGLRARQQLAATLARLGDLKGAHETMQKVLVLRKEVLIANHPDVQASRRDLAGVKLLLGDSKRALGLLRSALRYDEIHLSAGHPRLTYLNESLIPILFRAGQTDLAIQQQAALVKAREIAEPFVLEKLIAARETQAKMLYEIGQHDKSILLIAQNVAELKRDFGNQHFLVLYATQELTINRSRLGQSGRVISLFQHLVRVFENHLPRGHLDLVTGLSNLGLAQVAKGNLPAAKAVLRKLTMQMKQRAQIALTRTQDEAMLMMAKDRFAVDAAVFLSELCEPGEPKLLFELLSSRRLVEASHYAREEDDQVLQLRRQTLDAAEDLNAFLNSGLRESITAVILEQRLEMLTGASEEAEAALQAAMRERGLLPDVVVTWSTSKLIPRTGILATYARYTKFKLNDANHRIESMGDHMLAIILENSGKPKRADLGSIDELDRRVTRWRTSLGLDSRLGEMRDEDADSSEGLLGPDGAFNDGMRSQDGESEELAAGRELRLFLVAPILSLLPKDPETLFIVADDLIQLIPLDALPSYGERVGDSFDLVNLASIGDLQVRPSGPQLTPSYLAITEIDYDRGEEFSSRSGWVQAAGIDSSGLLNGLVKLPALPTSQAEVQVVFDALNREFNGGGRLLVGDEVNKLSLAKQVSGVGYLHFATHGWFAREEVGGLDDGQQFRSSVFDRELRFGNRGANVGLAISGANLGRNRVGHTPGILTIEELGKLDLSMCELVTLSGCNPGLDVQLAARGVEDLRFALHRAGTNYSLISLWDCDPEATKKMLQAFYTYHWKDDLPISKALWKAKRSLRAGGFPPRDWAGWNLTGYTAQ